MDRRTGEEDTRDDKVERRSGKGNRRESPSLLQDRINIVKQYGIVGFVVVMMPFATPYIEDYLADNQEALMRDISKDMAAKITLDIKEYINRENHVNRDVLIDITRLSVAKQSIHKVKFIKDLMTDYKDREVGNEKRIKHKIKVELYRQSEVYVTFLDNFEDPVIGRVGAYIATYFPMSSFLEGVNAIVLNEELSVDVRADDIMMYMLDAQDDFFIEMEAKMKKEM